MAKKPAIVWLMRHAETATPGIFHGAESDVVLSQRGELQSQAIARHFQALKPTVVVTSHMKRAIATGQPTAELLNLQPVVIPEFHERKVGPLSGTDFTASGGAWGETIKQWTSGNTSYKTTDAESFDEIQARVLNAWNQMEQLCPEERVLIVAHGVVCKVLILSLLKRFSPANWVELGPVPNCGITEFVWIDEQWQDQQLLKVPAEVLAFSEGQPTGIGTQRMK